MDPRGGLLLRLVAVIVPVGAVTALSALPVRTPTSVAAVLFVVAVVVAAGVGGARAGVASSVLAFLSLNYVFTPPIGTLSVLKGEDLVALVVFLAVALVIGTLVSRVVAQRARAEARERQARLLHRVSARLLAGEDPRDVLADVGERLATLLGLAGCAIELDRMEPIPDRAAPGGSPETMPLLVRDRQVGQVRIWSRTGRPAGEEDRQVVRAVAAQIALALDRRQAAEDAQTAHADAERSRLQAALLQSVTHDLRTPLASITASVTSLLDEEAVFDPDARTDLLQTIREEAGRLDRLVANLLEVSRLRAGTLVGERHVTSVEELIDAVLASLQTVLHGHRVELHIRDDLPDVSVDVIQVQQALTNIIENAAKFSAAGDEITIGAARWEDTVQIRVANRGRAVPPELRERVFHPFVRAGDEPGTGLGLAIAHAVVVGHGGSIWIEDAPGGGTAVVLRLPIEGPG
jgi:two-component system sensor histidine kinase KdpD